MKQVVINFDEGTSSDLKKAIVDESITPITVEGQQIRGREYQNWFRGSPNTVVSIKASATVDVVAVYNN